MSQPPIDSLLKDLKSEDEDIRTQATQELWQIWFMQKGDYGLDLIRQSQTLLEQGETRRAEDLLTELINDQPDFSEAWNRRAVLYYTLGKYQKSLKDCQHVIELNPIHFGAIHGMGLCYAALGDYMSAIKAFRRVLELQPYALINQKLILECTAMLN
ncbi:tetratricopeptide repeat protein [Tumidithrix elongata RA019]|uniref:Tetratricopeptide repeat protein n=1 Tax=Tumidithrix elongata BACA0141 TaxID=2716417 RepID=A0AAW9Q037_9CYAN|nr:tetratricopeptide repeat protein [Tumidithrix elongata RA019]